jgi:CubicO group peptidase (beta-lactamase class C family)
MLSVAIERASGRGFHDIVRERVFNPAGMNTAGFFRSDDLPASTALGYLRNGRTNVFHLPVIGGGDGGAYVTATDMTAFWEALFAGRLVSSDNVQTMTSHRSETNDDRHHYGLGFWLAAGGTAVVLEGMDAGVSCRSSYDPVSRTTYTVLANDSAGAWPISRHLETAIVTA